MNENYRPCYVISMLIRLSLSMREYATSVAEKLRHYFVIPFLLSLSAYSEMTD